MNRVAADLRRAPHLTVGAVPSKSTYRRGRQERAGDVNSPSRSVTRPSARLTITGAKIAPVAGQLADWHDR
jgi:hypothetical protein